MDEEEYDKLLTRKIKGVVNIFKTCLIETRRHLLGKSGASELSKMWEKFQINDEKGFGKLSTAEFANTVVRLQLGLNRKVRQKICEVLEDTNNPGSIDYDLFIESIRTFRESDHALQIKAKQGLESNAVLTKIRTEKEAQTYLKEQKHIRAKQQENNNKHRQVMQAAKAEKRKESPENRASWTGIKESTLTTTIGLDTRKRRNRLRNGRLIMPQNKKKKRSDYDNFTSSSDSGEEERSWKNESSEKPSLPEADTSRNIEQINYYREKMEQMPLIEPGKDNDVNILNNQSNNDCEQSVESLLEEKKIVAAKMEILRRVEKRLDPEFVKQCERKEMHASEQRAKLKSGQIDWKSLSQEERKRRYEKREKKRMKRLSKLAIPRKKIIPDDPNTYPEALRAKHAATFEALEYKREEKKSLGKIPTKLPVALTIWEPNPEWRRAKRKRDRERIREALERRGEGDKEEEKETRSGNDNALETLYDENGEEIPLEVQFEAVAVRYSGLRHLLIYDGFWVTSTQWKPNPAGRWEWGRLPEKRWEISKEAPNHGQAFEVQSVPRLHFKDPVEGPDESEIPQPLKVQRPRKRVVRRKTKENSEIASQLEGLSLREKSKLRRKLFMKRKLQKIGKTEKFYDPFASAESLSIEHRKRRDSEMAKNPEMRLELQRREQRRAKVARNVKKQEFIIRLLSANSPDVLDQSTKIEMENYFPGHDHKEVIRAVHETKSIMQNQATSEDRENQNNNVVEAVNVFLGIIGEKPLIVLEENLPDDIEDEENDAEWFRLKKKRKQEALERIKKQGGPTPLNEEAFVIRMKKKDAEAEKIRLENIEKKKKREEEGIFIWPTLKGESVNKDEKELEKLLNLQEEEAVKADRVIGVGRASQADSLRNSRWKEEMEKLEKRRAIRFMKKLDAEKRERLQLYTTELLKRDRMNYEQAVSIRRKLIALWHEAVQTGSQKTITFPASFQTSQRSIVHKIAKMIGADSDSNGSDGERRVTVVINPEIEDIVKAMTSVETSLGTVEAKKRLDTVPKAARRELEKIIKFYHLRARRTFEAYQICGKLIQFRSDVINANRVGKEGVCYLPKEFDAEQRRMVHKMAAILGIESRSEGEGTKNRRAVIRFTPEYLELIAAKAKREEDTKRAEEELQKRWTALSTPLPHRQLKKVQRKDPRKLRDHIREAQILKAKAMRWEELPPLDKTFGGPKFEDSQQRWKSEVEGLGKLVYKYKLLDLQVKDVDKKHDINFDSNLVVKDRMDKAKNAYESSSRLNELAKVEKNKKAKAYRARAKQLAEKQKLMQDHIAIRAKSHFDNFSRKVRTPLKVTKPLKEKPYMVMTKSLKLKSEPDVVSFMGSESIVPKNEKLAALQYVQAKDRARRERIAQMSESTFNSLSTAAARGMKSQGKGKRKGKSVKRRTPKKATAEAEKRAKAKAEAKKRAKAKADAEKKAKAKAEAKKRAKAKADAEKRAKAKADAEKRAKAKAEAKKKAKAKADAEKRAKAKAEAEKRAKAKADAEKRAKAKAEAEERAKAKAEAEKRAKAEAEERAKAKADAEKRAKAKADARAKAKAEEEKGNAKVGDVKIHAKIKSEAEIVEKAKVEENDFESDSFEDSADAISPNQDDTSQAVSIPDFQMHIRVSSRRLSTPVRASSSRVTSSYLPSRAESRHSKTSGVSTSHFPGLGEVAPLQEERRGIGYATAMFEHVAEEESELSFPEDAEILILEKRGLWYYGEYCNKQGDLPGNYVTFRPHPR
eukprot:g1639.t1